MADKSIEQRCNFETQRLSVSTWRDQVKSVDAEKTFSKKVIEILSPGVTKSLPDGWQNIKTTPEAKEWINERDKETHFATVQLSATNETVGFIFLYESDSKSESNSLKLRFGYLLSEQVWGKGLGTELIKGLLNWCREAGDIHSISGGVETDNMGSIKVMKKTGFSISTKDESTDKVLFYTYKFQKTAIILGATGLTGRLLLNKLIADDNYTSIILFSRKASGNTSPKVEEFIGDLLQLEHFKNEFNADVVYCCIGTTSAKTKDRAVYRAVDYGIPLTASTLARANQIPTFIAISAMGANVKSNIFYNRTKGEMEQAVLNQKIPNTFILRPSLILGERDEKRFGESLGAVLLKISHVFLAGRLKKYRAIEADCIANAMINLAKSNHNTQIVNSDMIQKLGS